MFFTGLNRNGKLKLYSWDDANGVLKQITDLAGATKNDFDIGGAANAEGIAERVEAEKMLKMRKNDALFILIPDDRFG